MRKSDVVFGGQRLGRNLSAACRYDAIPKVRTGSKLVFKREIQY